MNDTLTDYRTRFNALYPTLLPQDAAHIGDVFHAVRYCFDNGGKRLRPALIYALAESLSLSLEVVDYVAMAVECIHTYSLIHDDLPDMDNDDMRRGKPSCHIQFDNATAILAGDALNTLAFELLATNPHLSPEKKLKQIAQLAHGAGIAGMVGGQDTDLACENHAIAVDQGMLSTLHQQKTAKLIESALLMTYLASDAASEEKMASLSRAALSLGLFYQIQDDVLEATQTSETLGKSAQSDVDNGKITYVSLLGIAQAQQVAHETQQQLNTDLQRFFAPERDYLTTPLASIITKITARNH